jgi:hypothetical protein
MNIARPSKTWFGKTITASATTTDLAPVYDTACRMTEQAASVDEVATNVLDEAVKMQAYGRQAGNRELQAALTVHQSPRRDVQLSITNTRALTTSV